MDSIWTWVVSYLWELRLSDDPEWRAMAEKFEEFSGLAAGENRDAVEAAYPELLAFVRREENPWAEVYVRHWRLQAYVNAPADLRPLIPEALDLLAFAHSEPAKDCPQRVCVADDLNAIYGQIDALGYAEDRLTMIRELLDTTPPHLECYSCLTYGELGVLTDLGRPEEALASYRRRLAASDHVREETQREHYRKHLAPAVAWAHLRAGEHEAAWAVTEECEPPKPFRLFEHALLRAETHLALGRRDEAQAAFADALAIDEEFMDGTLLADAARALHGAGLVEDRAGLTELLLRISATAIERGRVREAFDAGAAAFELAEADMERARNALTAMERAAPELQAPMGADATLETARSRAPG